jgi:hypothetical protein
MRAHSKLIQSGDVTFYIESTLELAQRDVRESSEDSNSERENDAHTKAPQTKEQRGRARDVSSKLTWKEGSPEHKTTYQKWKMSLTP